MKCFSCNKGELISHPNQSYQYTECGLDDVWLEGIELLICDECGSINPVLPKVLQLHAIISQAIIHDPAPLSGDKIRFLRKELGIKAKDWASYIGVEPETLSRWEKGNQLIGTQSDLLIRAVYCLLKSGKQVPKTQNQKAPGQMRINVGETNLNLRFDHSGLCLT